MSKPEVTDAEIEAGLEELLHERHSLGDGCFGCGYGGWWNANSIANNRHRHRELVKHVLEAAAKQHAPAPSIPFRNDTKQGRHRIDDSKTD